MSDNIVQISDASFEQDVLQAPGPVLVDFWAEWCGPCKRYGPLFERFGEANKDKAKFVKVNVEEAEDIAMQFGVQSIPTTIIFKDGKEIGREVGILTEQYLTGVVKSNA